MTEEKQTTPQLSIELDEKMKKEVPLAIQNKIAAMDPAEQEMFLQEFKKRRKNIHIAFLFFILGLHYLYLKEFVKFFLFLFTMGGFGIWYLIDLFRGNSMIRTANQNAALEAFKNTKALA
jgi:TM2 domain-containing membrane protein YozV